MWCVKNIKLISFSAGWAKKEFHQARFSQINQYFFGLSLNNRKTWKLPWNTPKCSKTYIKENCKEHMNHTGYSSFLWKSQQRTLSMTWLWIPANTVAVNGIWGGSTPCCKIFLWKILANCMCMMFCLWY